MVNDIKTKKEEVNTSSFFYVVKQAYNIQYRYI